MKIVRKILSLLIIFSLLIPVAGCNKTEKGYAGDLFDASRVHSIEVTLSDTDMKDLLNNPLEKTKYEARIVIDGETVEKVSFATKGNSSLYLVARDGDSHRYSFKVNFGKFKKGQTFHGLDKLNLQNLFMDNTYMKDYMCYWLFNSMGVEAPLASYVKVTVNGEYYGLYLAVEEIDKSFLERTLDGEGALYKPENQLLELDEDSAEDIGKGGSVIVEESVGADFAYTDDDKKHYTDIFDNDVCGDSEEVQDQILEALKALSANRDLEDHFDTEKLIRYFAVNNFLCNYDGYTGPMLHNYYLYVKDGKLSLHPWDYNLSLGAFPMDGVMGHDNDAELVINQGMDSPLVITKNMKRPMWTWITEYEDYLYMYHDVMNELLKTYNLSGETEKEMERVYELIRPYVEEDPTAFCSPAEFDRGFEAMKMFFDLRGASIGKQLDGGLAAITEDQRPEDRIDVSRFMIGNMTPKVKGN